jgi:membrane-associated phospholipid phosphatase
MILLRAMAWLVSGLFHPLLLGWLLPAALLFLEQASQGMPFDAMTQLLLCTGMFVVPSLLLLLLKKQGRVHSLLLSLREERHVVYLTSLLWFFSFAAMIQLLPAFGTQSHVYGLLWLNTLSALLLWQVNLRWNKASAHAAAGSALLMYLSFIPPFSGMMFPMCILFLLIVASRAVLKAHSPAELLSGTLCGAVAALPVLIWLR